MKNKFLIFALLLLSVLGLTACKGGKNLDITDYLIEERNTLFTAQDELYSATYSTGKREKDYALDGVKNEMVDFGVVTFSRLDSSPLAKDNYTYLIKINDKEYTGFLEKSSIDNSYSIDIGVATDANSTVTIKVSFTGYTFNQDMCNVTSDFKVDTASALKIANRELKQELNNLSSDKNNKVESVMKILKDYSNSEVKSYYWYVGVVSTNGDTMGILIDANTGDVVAKKL